MKKIKLLIFDIDNTLVYGAEAKKYYEQYPKLLEKTLGKSLGITQRKAKEIADEHRQLFDGRGEKAFETHKLGLNVWHETICTLKPKKYLRQLPASNETLIDLKRQGYEIGAITDGPTKQALKILNAVGINKNIFSIFIGWENGQKIPKGGRPDVYQKIVKDKKLKPEEIIMIGDSLAVDIIPAKACGLNVIYINKSSKTIFPNIDSIEKLPTYLKNKYG